jgi:hypothetical protein
MTCASTNGTGTLPPELFVPVRPCPSTQPILPGEDTYWQSLQTGKFCRVVAEAGRQQVLCDSDTLAGATLLTYTGSGARRMAHAGPVHQGVNPAARSVAVALGYTAGQVAGPPSDTRLSCCTGISYQGLALASPGSGGGAAHFAPPGPLPGGSGAAAATVTVTPAPGPTLLPDTAINILGSSGNGALRVDGPGSAAYVGQGNGSSPQEQFCANSPSSPAQTSPFVPGDLVLLKNKVSSGFGLLQLQPPLPMCLGAHPSAPL